MGHIGTPKRSRRAAESLLAREADWLERNGLVGQVVQQVDGTWLVEVGRDGPSEPQGAPRA